MPRGRKTVKNDKRNGGAARASRKEDAGRVAAKGRKTAGRKSAKSADYEHMTRMQLYDKARQVGIHGRSHMSKNELIDALRSH
jgi:hypothetical protein